jgi:virulence factor Mce-like protein
MRRTVAIGAAAALAVAAVIAIAVSVRGGGGYSVTAVFDQADGILNGSQVKIAGATVGSVTRVELAPGPTARIVMSIDARFRPFHRNATCTILPEGLISENYVECDPGSGSAPVLAAAAGSQPTVPLARTTIPLSLQQLLNVFSMPTDERIQVMLSELGIAFAGRGADLSALLVRSNPALAQAQRALGILAGQRRQLADGIAQTNHVLASLATNIGSVRRFVDTSAAVSRTSAAHATALAASLKRFPPLLNALNPALRALDQAAVTGTPVLAPLAGAAPELTALNRTLPAFLGAGMGAIPSFSSASRAGSTAIRDSTALVSDLRTAAVDAIPFAADGNATLISIRNTGGIEAFLQQFYGLAASTGGYDSLSHFQTGYLSVFPQCLKSPAGPGCDTRYDSPGQGTIPANDPGCGPQNDEPWAPETDCTGTGVIALRRTRRAAGTTSTPTRTALTATATTAPSPTTTVAPSTPTATTTAPSTTTPAPGVGAVVSGLLKYLLGK